MIKEDLSMLFSAISTIETLFIFPEASEFKINISFRSSSLSFFLEFIIYLNYYPTVFFPTYSLQSIAYHFTSVLCIERFCLF